MTIDNAVASGGEDFLRLADPYRHELMAHCYRMLGSVHDAEDLVQETYLRAWRSHERFEGRSSLRTWLYRIATRACLTALERRGRRPLPTGIGAPSANPDDDLIERPEASWLEPMPDAAIGGDKADPAAIVASRSTLRLAFVAALQHLPPRQRAVLLLREVLGWRASEVAEHLDMSIAAVNSALQRARAQVQQAAPAEDELAEPTAVDQRALLDRYIAAFERKDVATLVELFSNDVVWEMPPFASWYRGAEHVGHHLRHRCPGDLRLVPVSANGQPGFAKYLRGDDGIYAAFNLQVLTVTTSGIKHVVNFLDPELFTAFGLPRTLPATR